MTSPRPSSLPPEHFIDIAETARRLDVKVGRVYALLKRPGVRERIEPVRHAGRTWLDPAHLAMLYPERPASAHVRPRELCEELEMKASAISKQARLWQIRPIIHEGIKWYPREALLKACMNPRTTPIKAPAWFQDLETLKSWCPVTQEELEGWIKEGVLTATKKGFARAKVCALIHDRLIQPTPARLLLLNDVCQGAAFSRDLYALAIRTGEMRGLRLAGRLYVRPEEFEAYEQSKLGATSAQNPLDPVALISTQEAVTRFDLSEQYLCLLGRQGTLTSHRQGSSLYWEVEELEAFCLPPKGWIVLEELASARGITRESVHKLIAQDKLRARRVRAIWYLDPESLPSAFPTHPYDKDDIPLTLEPPDPRTHTRLSHLCTLKGLRREQVHTICERFKVPRVRLQGQVYVELIAFELACAHGDVSYFAVIPSGWHKVVDIAPRVGLSADHIKRLIRQGKIEGIKKENRWWVDEHALHAYTQRKR